MACNIIGVNVNNEDAGSVRSLPSLYEWSLDHRHIRICYELLLQIERAGGISSIWRQSAAATVLFHCHADGGLHANMTNRLVITAIRNQ